MFKGDLNCPLLNAIKIRIVACRQRLEKAQFGDFLSSKECLCVVGGGFCMFILFAKWFFRNLMTAPVTYRLDKK